MHEVLGAALILSARRVIGAGEVVGRFCSEIDRMYFTREGEISVPSCLIWGKLFTERELLWT